MADKDEVQRHLVSSELYMEDRYDGDHEAVWGSFFDRERGLWGYACCLATQRHQSCKKAKDAQERAKAKQQLGSEDDSDESDEDSAEGTKEKPIDWSTPPLELLAPSEVQGGRSEAYVEHFIRFVVGAWRRQLESGSTICDASLSAAELEPFRSTNALQQAESSLAPLVEQLGRGDVDSHVYSFLNKMITLAASREYAEAGRVYMELALGHKKWNNVYSNFQAMNTNKGARMKIIEQSDLTKYDSDPVAQRYIQSVRKLVQFAQIIRPNADLAKHMRT